MNKKNIKRNVEKIIAQWDERTRKNKENFDFGELTLSTGLPGIILMLAELKNKDNSKIYQKKIDNYIEYIVSKLSTYGLLTGSLYSGAAGIALSILHLREDDEKYKNLLDSLNRYIEYFVIEKIEGFNLENITPPDYDVIEGLSGILSYLLLINDEQYDDLKILIINFLSNLTKENKGLISLYIKSENQMSQSESEMYPLGCLNMGLAHGLAGAGCILAYAHIKGYSNEASLSALQKIIFIYEKFELERKNQFLWKDGLVADELKKEKVIREASFIRDAWCYGGPGISLLYLYGGLALDNDYFVDKAEKILESAMQRKLGIDSYMICHGYSGLIEICSLFKRLLNTKKFDSYIEEFNVNSEQILEEYGDESGTGFLEGISGCILVLSKFEYSINFTYWRQALLLFDDFLKGGKRK
ncbi:lanthionine synthetase C family protein [Lactococcus lactis]|jgi:Lantibiotic modifying enzyme|uniref:Nisin biosynthesis protein NisC n=4 Tax=Streptococcaceae TaxID=1300 RepID=A0AAP8E2V8_9LACT|nr:lanthionine synthetase C family protein [Lactococcus lactis]AIS03233.1 Nisin biosynthesis protein NisC [Lactococcus lactis]KST77683.1 Lanthionine biosynthesis cyclase LanC [Lactococcus lactis subsp. lactis]KST83026.1 Lanthionine biosynthesis cyclase LanC [Lactococcus lactis subsp. lactis]KST88403.1 Lanthionine biosynthesis cyclase LanC [Lactococcus lactis subsp. lactis]KST89875.1 Lanthionine biosynthesis cyclase LanC [Lactococcus lactis subsp. lactis]